MLNVLLKELNDDMTSLKATDYSKERVNSGGAKSCALEAVIDEISKIENQLKAAIQKKYETKQSVTEFICHIDNKNLDQDILIDKYINLMSYGMIEKKYGYTYESAKNKLSIACGKLARIVG